MALSRVSDKKRHHEWKPYIRSYVPYMVPGSKNLSGTPPSKNTPCTSTLSLRNTKMQNIGDWRQGSSKITRSKEMGVLDEESEGLKSGPGDHVKKKLNSSCNESARSYYTRGVEAYQARWDWTMIQHPERGMGNQRKRNESINRNYLGTPRRLPQKLEKLTRTEKRHERPLPYSKRTTVLPSKKSVERQQPHKDSPMIDP
jgi:hypothetical protein